MKNNKELFDCMLKEIELIQNIINRMRINSFMIKGWTITLVVVTLLLKGTKYQVFIAFLPLLVFWFLDSYYLWQERMYRELYNWVVDNRLKSDKALFNMDAYRFEHEVQPKYRIMFSITLIWFYGIIAILISIYSCILFIL